VPSWKPFKTTARREAEAEIPPPLRDSLDKAGACRLAQFVENELGGDVWVAQFHDYLAFQLGSGKQLPNGALNNIQYQKGSALGRHIMLCVAGDSLSLRDFLDWWAQYFVERTSTFKKSTEAKSLVMRAVRSMNELMKHEAMLFRIVEDQVHRYAVHRLGSEAMRERIVRPALEGLSEARMDEALREYEEALVEWAKGGTDNAIRQASHAVETTMKTILQRLEKAAKADANPSTLIAALVEAGVLPPKYADFHTKLSAGIQGVITVRSAEAGAGHGPAPGQKDPDEATAEYAVNLAGANILYLVKQYQRCAALP
jgi:hypothetical protein